MNKLLALVAALQAITMANAAEVRVLTYNIHHGEGTDGRLDLERIATIILSQTPDVVCLQEIDKNLSRTNRIDFPARLAELLKMNVAYGPNYFFDDGEYGNATLSRFPIVHEENIPLPTPKGIEPRGVLKVVLKIDTEELTVFNTHWGLKPDQRKEQAAALLKHLPQKHVVVAGDLNEESDATGVSQLLGPLRDSYLSGEKNAPGTIGQGENSHRIDFILASPDLNVLSSRVVVSADAQIASDHAPYLAVLSLASPTERDPIQGDHGDQGDRLNKAIRREPPTWPEKNTGSR